MSDLLAQQAPLVLPVLLGLLVLWVHKALRDQRETLDWLGFKARLDQQDLLDRLARLAPKGRRARKATLEQQARQARRVTPGRPALRVRQARKV